MSVKVLPTVKLMQLQGASSLRAPVSKHIAYFTHINIASSVDTYQVHQLALAENARVCSVNEQEKVVQAINSLLKRTSWQTM